MAATAGQFSAVSGVGLLEIRLFGQPQVLASGKNLTQHLTRRAVLLIAILALREGKPIERQTLAGMLWPESTDAAGLHNLRQTLAAVRRTLGSFGDLVTAVSPRSLLLEPSPSLGVDVLQFDALSAEGTRESLERALEICREPLLTGCDEPFAMSMRQSREQALHDAAVRLAALCADAGEHALAASALRRALAVDGYREQTCRALMKSLAACGEAAAALEAYIEFRRKLRTDLRTEPDDETKSVYRAIRASATESRLSPRPRPSHLPNPVSPIIGRESEIGEVARLLARCRLVTLSGFGGVGKTRLALATAARIESRFLDGAAFVDLSSIQSGDTVLPTIATALDIQEHAETSLHRAVAKKIQEKERLLILDNCEQVVEGAAESVEFLLSAAPNLTILATSRQSLGVSGELVWRVPPLSVPDSIAAGQGEGPILESDAVRLFLERSRSARGSASAGRTEIDQIASICRRLEGIPLAIELAAARTRVLSVSEIEARLDDRFKLLAGGSRTVARHQTLQAAVEWSWDALTDTERNLLMRLSAFRGGFTMQFAEAISESSEPGQILDTVSSLVDRSLVIASPAEMGTRFSMLETIRQFAAERLEESGLVEEVSSSHRDLYLRWAADPRPPDASPEEVKRFEEFEIEHDNLRAALAWCHAHRDGEEAVRLGLALSRFWDTHGHVTEGRGHLEGALVLAGSALPQRLAAWAHGSLAWMAIVQSDGRAAVDHSEKALAIYQTLGDDLVIASGFNGLGSAYYIAGEYTLAISALERALDLARALNRGQLTSTVLGNMAEVALASGQVRWARECLEESMREAKKVGGGSQQQRGLNLCDLALIDTLQGSYNDASNHTREALGLFQRLGLLVNIPLALHQSGILESLTGHGAAGATLLGASEALAASQGVQFPRYYANAWDQAVSKCRSELGEAAFEGRMIAGRKLTLKEAIALALK